MHYSSDCALVLNVSLACCQNSPHHQPTAMLLPARPILGAGMRASLHMKLPNMTNKGRDLTRVKAEALNLGLAVRGAGGEHSDAGSDGLVDISPSARLGVTEMQIMQRLYDGAAALWVMEQRG